MVKYFMRLANTDKIVPVSESVADHIMFNCDGEFYSCDADLSITVIVHNAILFDAMLEVA